MGLAVRNIASVNPCCSILSNSGFFPKPLSSATNIHFLTKTKIRTKNSVRASTEVGISRTGPASQYAKQMERYAAKETLTLAIKDAGVLDALPIGRVTDVQRIDINERIIKLERLNPTPRPTTSPYLEGQWRYEWVGVDNPVLSAANLLFESLPAVLVSVKNLQLRIMDGTAKATASLKLLDSIECNMNLNTKLSIEGPLRIKDEYVDLILQTPTVPETAVPSQLKGFYEQALTAFQQFPDPVKQTISDGLRIPLSQTFQRLFVISYLDEEILIIRDISGTASVLSRLNVSSVLTAEPVSEYES